MYKNDLISSFDRPGLRLFENDSVSFSMDATISLGSTTSFRPKDLLRDGENPSLGPGDDATISARSEGFTIPLRRASCMVILSRGMLTGVVQRLRETLIVVEMLCEDSRVANWARGLLASVSFAGHSEPELAEILRRTSMAACNFGSVTPLFSAPSFSVSDAAGSGEEERELLRNAFVSGSNLYPISAAGAASADEGSADLRT